MKEIEIKNSIDLVDYESSVKFMQSRILGIQNKNEKELIWFLNHNHVYTQGTSAKKSEIINTNQASIIKTNRGGKTTYHGPGQRIVYLLINLNKRQKDIRKFISIIENSLISYLNKYNIDAKSFEDRVGIWVKSSEKISFKQERKIGAIGLRISKWISYHGLSFNINPNLDYYKYIHPCGLKNFKNTSLSELGLNVSNDEFDSEFTTIFLNKLNKL